MHKSATIFGLLVSAVVQNAAAAHKLVEVDVVVVAPDSSTSALTYQINQGLLSEPLQIHWDTRSDFNTDEFLAATHTEQQVPRPSAWIDVRDRNAISVYFRDAAAQRFFLRRFPKQINDIVLAEQVVQVIAPSLAALADHSRTALTRAQIKTELAVTQTPAATPRHADVQPPVLQVSSPPTTRAVAIESSYVAQWIVAGSAAAHGARLRFSSRWNNSLGDVTVWTSVLRPIAFEPQGLDGRDWDLDLWDGRLGLAFLVARTKDIGISVGIAGGANWVSARPAQTANAVSSRFIPALHWEVRTELRLVPWLYGTFGVTLDALPPTLLDHVLVEGSHEAIRLASWQPGAWLGLEVRSNEF